MKLAESDFFERLTPLDRRNIAPRINKKIRHLKQLKGTSGCIAQLNQAKKKARELTKRAKEQQLDIF